MLFAPGMGKEAVPEVRVRPGTLAYPSQNPVLIRHPRQDRKTSLGARFEIHPILGLHTILDRNDFKYIGFILEKDAL